MKIRSKEESSSFKPLNRETRSISSRLELQENDSSPKQKFKYRKDLKKGWFKNLFGWLNLGDDLDNSYFIIYHTFNNLGALRWDETHYKNLVFEVPSHQNSGFLDIVAYFHIFFDTIEERDAKEEGFSSDNRKIGFGVHFERLGPDLLFHIDGDQDSLEDSVSFRVPKDDAAKNSDLLQGMPDTLGGRTKIAISDDRRSLTVTSFIYGYGKKTTMVEDTITSEEKDNSSTKVREQEYEIGADLYLQIEFTGKDIRNIILKAKEGKNIKDLLKGNPKNILQDKVKNYVKDPELEKSINEFLEKQSLEADFYGNFNNKSSDVQIESTTNSVKNRTSKSTEYTQSIDDLLGSKVTSRVIIKNNIPLERFLHFETDEFQLTADHKKIIDDFIRSHNIDLTLLGLYKVSVTGAASMSGAEEHNKTLSEKRASEVWKYLYKKHQLNKADISGIGETQATIQGSLQITDQWVKIIIEKQY